MIYVDELIFITDYFEIIRLLIRSAMRNSEKAFNS
jgi:hypothetical protein